MQTNEFWIERDIHGYKASSRDRVVTAPEMCMAHSYLMGCAISKAHELGSINTSSSFLVPNRECVQDHCPGAFILFMSKRICLVYFLRKLRSVDDNW